LNPSGTDTSAIDAAEVFLPGAPEASPGQSGPPTPTPAP